MRRSILLAALLLFWAGVTGAQVAPQAVPAPESGRRVALVVGIGTYQHAGRLQATVSDARLMARTLQAFGFTLVTGGAVVEVDKRGFDAAIQEFGRLAAGADIAFFYFSGHGLQYNGNNWLVARDSGPLSRPADLEFSFVDVGAVLRQLEAAQARLSILVLDACRNDPFRSSATRDATGAGLAAMRAPRGTIIAYATQPGNTSLDGQGGRNSPYTAALVQAMRIPGLGLMQMFNEASLRAIDLSGGHQEPWLAISPLRGDFVFTARDGAAAPGLPAAVAPGPPTAAAPGLPAATGAPPTAAPALAVAQDPDFTLVNLAGRPVRELHASLASDRQWGQDRLGGNLLQAGERFRLTFPRDHGCNVDVRAGFGQGAESGEIRNLDTCAVDMLVLTPQGRLVPANPDVRLVNETGRPIQRIEASLVSESNWGPDRLAGKALAPGATLELHLPQGVTCDVDIRARFADGTMREWRRQDTCAVAQYTLR
jgi:hypothetical protein